MIRRNLFAGIIAPFVPVASAIKTEKKIQKCSCGAFAKVRSYGIKIAAYGKTTDSPILKTGFAYGEAAAVCKDCVEEYTKSMSRKLSLFVASEYYKDPEFFPKVDFVGVFIPLTEDTSNLVKLSKEKYYKRLNS